MGAISQQATRDKTALGVVPTILDVNFCIGFELCNCYVGKDEQQIIKALNQQLADSQMTKLNASFMYWGAGEGESRW
jgi:hypothetical protein